jgi:cardiolipin synthase
MNSFLSLNLWQIFNIFLITLVIFFERKRNSHTLAWVLILSFTSYFGFILYLFFGLSFRKEKRLKSKESNQIFKQFLIKRNKLLEKTDTHSIKEEFLDLAYYHEYNSKSLYYPSNSINLYTDGTILFSDIRDSLLKAKSFIHMEYYIFRNDQLGREVRDILVRKAKEGVEVKLIYDGMGCIWLKKSFFKQLKKAGGKVNVFFPPFVPYFSIRANYRTHRKIIIVDGKEAYLGGFNIGDEYLGKSDVFGYWRDTHLKVEGDVIDSLQSEFLLDWIFVSGNKFLVKDIDLKKYFFEREHYGKSGMQIVGSGPNYEYPYIKDGILKMIQKAKKSIYIQTPYYIPDEAIHDSLKLAILSGIDVYIMIPNKPDHIFVYWATLSHIGDLIEAGAKVYTYQNGFLHSKIIIIDDEIASVGTTNMDFRSFYFNFEINSFIYDSDFSLKLKEKYIEDIKYSRHLTRELYRKRGNIIKFKESVSRLLSPLL